MMETTQEWFEHAIWIAQRGLKQLDMREDDVLLLWCKPRIVDYPQEHPNGIAWGFVLHYFFKDKRRATMPFTIFAKECPFDFYNSTSSLDDYLLTLEVQK